MSFQQALESASPATFIVRVDVDPTGWGNYAAYNYGIYQIEELLNFVMIS
jgi:hypothetical protein